MIKIVNRSNAADHADLLGAMHRLRKSMFKDRLGWEVTTIGDHEVDAFDAVDPVYVLATAPDQTLAGCIRLLPTRGPNMLRDVFPHLLGGCGIPCDDRIWEASRFAIVARVPRCEAGLASATYEVVTGVVNFCLGQGIDAIVCVVDPQMERVLRRTGCTVQRLGEVRRIGATTAFAAQVDISVELLRTVADRAGYMQYAAA